MERESLMNLISNLRNNFDNAETRDEILTEISNEISSVYDTNASISTTNSEYEKQNEQLRKANMKLFLQIGAAPIKDDKPEEVKETEETPKLKFEDLFNENGGIK